MVSAATSFQLKKPILINSCNRSSFTAAALEARHHDMQDPTQTTRTARKSSRRFSCKQSELLGIPSKARALVEEAPTSKARPVSISAGAAGKKKGRRFSCKQSELLGIPSKARAIMEHDPLLSVVREAPAGDERAMSSPTRGGNKEVYTAGGGSIDAAAKFTTERAVSGPAILEGGRAARMSRIRRLSKAVVRAQPVGLLAGDSSRAHRGGPTAAGAGAGIGQVRACEGDTRYEEGREHA